MTLTEHAKRLAREARAARKRLRLAECERMRGHYAEQAAKAEAYNTPDTPALLKVQAE